MIKKEKNYTSTKELDTQNTKKSHTYCMNYSTIFRERLDLILEKESWTTIRKRLIEQGLMTKDGMAIYKND